MSIKKEIKLFKERQSYEMPKYLDWFKLKSDAIGICADIHIPFHSWVWCERFIKICKKFKCRSILIGGDFFQMEAISKWFEKARVRLKRELDISGYLLKEFIKHFDNIYIHAGNHDNWIKHFTNGELSFYQLFEIIFGGTKSEKLYRQFRNKVVISEYPYSIINDKWRITHPKNYSQVKLTVASRLADKYHKNVINAHGHYLSMGYSRSGKEIIIDVGGLFDREKMYYIMMSDATHPVWNNGFLVIRNNYPYLFGEFTDWDFWGKIKI